METKKFEVGDRVVITQLGDDTHIIHAGEVLEVNGEWICIRIDGEDIAHEWPIERVWPEPSVEGLKIKE